MRLSAFTWRQLLLLSTLPSLLFLSFSLQAQNTSALPDFTALDAYYEKSRQDWDVPGMAIAIVKNDSIVFAKGYGVLNNKTGGPVNANTIFGIASNTKAYTAAALAMLVEEGKLDWHDPVTKYLPYFQLYNPYVSQAINIRDLLSHRVGLPTYSGDLLWYNTTYSREEIVRRARFLKPTYAFRDGYGYSNLMFIAAGQVIEAVSGQTWENFIRTRILQPLGMQQTYLSVKELTGKPNIASPHGFDAQRKPVPTTFNPWDAWNPAAGIFTSVNQHAQWLRLQLNRGTYKGKRIFSEKSSHEMWAPVQSLPISPEAKKNIPSTHFSATGLGWFLTDYQGCKIVGHGGGHEGMNSRTVLVPEENLGFVVLTNSMSSIMTALANRTIDAFLNVPNPRDWSQINLATVKASEAGAGQPAGTPSTKTKIVAATSKKFIGRYTSTLYGDAIITETNKALQLQLVAAPTLGGKLISNQENIFDLQWKNPYALLTPTQVRFFTNPEGILEMRLDANNPDFIFSELEFKKVK
ncbi:serine hydrolase domain-containing protein [Adhaeribacter radiodurans]|uniref:Serine hydrolase n=1 Tax=Adhaeribacter radiodurans TaxID=2745197 RepID=A0A7L7LBR4_9BACT|nr:serine hydrolase domain-containing protein [Adhaeribacter radiodurans]QMU30213.1 serine hydrolase [Adhaeribacter radiodurans]